MMMNAAARHMTRSERTMMTIRRMVVVRGMLICMVSRE
jgi:hypothetical protein